MKRISPNLQIIQCADFPVHVEFGGQLIRAEDRLAADLCVRRLGGSGCVRCPIMRQTDVRKVCIPAYLCVETLSGSFHPVSNRHVHYNSPNPKLHFNFRLSKLWES